MPSSPPPPRSGAYSSSSGEPTSLNTTATTAVPVTQTTRLRPPRTLPPWIDSYEETYGPAPADQLALLRPPTSVTAHHNSNPDKLERRVSRDGFVDLDDPRLGPGRKARPKVPHILRHGRASRYGRRWDHLRSAEPVIVPSSGPMMAQNEMAWNDFVQSSAWGHDHDEESEVVAAGDLEKLQPNFGRAPVGAFSLLDVRRSSSRRKRTLALYKRVWNLVMRHSLSPLVFRLVVMVTSVVALGLAGRIYVLEVGRQRHESVVRTQSIVAIAVDCIAVPYLGYMIWDEYTGKPLGLRSAVSKVSLIMLDLVFIIFKSASTALAFQSLVYNDVTRTAVRDLAQALAAFLLVALIAWTMNLTVNIFRTVERLGGGEDDNWRR